MMLKEQPSELNVKLISDRARKHEMNLFSTAKSKVLLVNFSMFSNMKLMFFVHLCFIVYFPIFVI